MTRSWLLVCSVSSPYTLLFVFKKKLIEKYTAFSCIFIGLLCVRICAQEIVQLLFSCGLLPFSFSISTKSEWNISATDCKNINLFKFVIVNHKIVFSKNSISPVFVHLILFSRRFQKWCLPRFSQSFTLIDWDSSFLMQIGFIANENNWNAGWSYAKKTKL